MSEEPTREAVVLVHQAGSWTEAVVIRGLLRSVGIESPTFSSADPFPMREPPKGLAGVEIWAYAPEADEARRVIADYLAGQSGGDESDSTATSGR